MELVFEAQSIDYLRPVRCKSCAQEQTQELIVPTAIRIAADCIYGRVRGDAGKEARTEASVTGGGAQTFAAFREDGTGGR